MTTGYSHKKFPPSPILKVQLSLLGEPANSPMIDALIDTGSDFSLAPQKMLIALGAPIYELTTVRGLWGPRHEAILYLIDIHLESGVLPAVEIVGVGEHEGAFENEEIILGRNMLNKLILLLEGPKQQTTILERRPLRF